MSRSQVPSPVAETGVGVDTVLQEPQSPIVPDTTSVLLRFPQLLHQFVILGVTNIRWTDLLFLNIVLCCLKNL